MKLSLCKFILAGILLVTAWAHSGWAQDNHPAPNSTILTLQEFIQLATKNDTEFESILIDALPLQYLKDLNLPARDIVLSVKTQYNFIIGQNRDEPEASVSLSKLFPFTGTEISAAYKNKPSFISTDSTSDFTFTIAQPIAENAFGRGTRLQDKIIGVEIDVAKHQIGEAYEDYLASAMIAYYSWYEAYENLQVGTSSYNENLKLMDNVKGRQKSSIALSIDVNKINLQVLAKKEKLVELHEKYQKALNFIIKAIRYEGDDVFIPQATDMHAEMDVIFEKDYAVFKTRSRTYQVLHLLEEKSTLDVAKSADDLLPSINLLVGYTVDGEDFRIRNEDSMIFAGMSLDWPLGDQVDRSEHETAKIIRDKRRHITANTHYRLYTDIKNLSQQIDREKQLMSIAREKISLAQSVLTDETENYSFAKVTINDYIDAVNVYDSNQFNTIFHEVQYKKLMVEWLRITDRLITKDVTVKKNHSL